MITRREMLAATAAVVPLCARGASLSAGSELTELSAREVAEHIRQGSIKAEVYFARLIRQCRAHADLNAIASLDEARMLEQARAIDQARARGDTLGPAAGLPVAVKDQIEEAGYPAASGNAALRNYRPGRNSEVVERLVQAGAVAFAKTTCPNMTGNTSLMAQVDSYSPLYGLVRNPYDPRRMAGGSSGGNGVALAARMVPAALGEDTNGSIRIPAAFCGVAGLRPSTYTLDNALTGARRKRYSDDGLVIPPTIRLDTIGPMARCVADVAFLDQLVTGETPPALSMKGARVGVPRPDYWDQEWVDEGVARATQAAFARLRDAGAKLVEIDYVALRETIGHPRAVSYFGMAVVMLNADPYPEDRVAKWIASNRPGMTVEEFEGVPISHQPWSPFPPARPVEEQTRLIAAAGQMFADLFKSNGLAAIASPTVSVPPQILTPSGSTDRETVTIKGKVLDRGIAVVRQTMIAPRYGAPALSLPVGLTEGLPVGMELLGLPGEDSRLLGLGIAVENALGPISPPRLVT